MVVVVGGGPGGVLTAYLLARAGVRVTLLESRGDFDRRFRGDSIAPPVLDYLDTLGLAEDMLARIPHGRATAFEWCTEDKRYVIADYRTASRKYPYYALVPQAEFLPYMVEQASRYPGFEVRMGARVSGLLRDASGRVTGVEYGQERVEADLVIGADGRNSKLRALSTLRATELASSIDICWFAVPRLPTDVVGRGQLSLVTAPGQVIGLLGQARDWQIGFTIPAGTFDQVRARGVTPLVDAVRRLIPWLADRVTALTDVNQLTLLPIRITTLDHWTEPGLLLIGDAAHVISPVGGNGINHAIIDAAETANHLSAPLISGNADAIDAACRAVEASRRPVVEAEQRMQVRIERGTARRLTTGAAGAPLPIKIQAGVPGLAAYLARRSLRALAVPTPPPVQ